MTDYETKLLPAIHRVIAEERLDAVAINALNHSADALEIMALECDRMREFFDEWAHDGRLQTFQDRERFRAAWVNLGKTIAQKIGEQ